MPALVAGIHVFLNCRQQDVDGRDKRAFTPVFDGLCPAMTTVVGMRDDAVPGFRCAQSGLWVVFFETVRVGRHC
jgi:hypothetical protein